MKLSQNDLIDQLKIKVKSMIKSADDFDLGSFESAVDLSVIIRTLLHDTPKSNSLLKQLDRKEIRYLTTAEGINNFDNDTPQFTLMDIVMNPDNGIYYYPFTQNSLVADWVSFNDWWEEIVIFIPRHNIEIKRSNLVLKLANKYGAHIGTDIPKYYHDLFKAKDYLIGFNWFKNGDKMNHLHTPIFPSIRQIVHELLISLDNEFEELRSLTKLYFGKLNSNQSRIDGISNYEIQTSIVKSKSLIAFEKLNETGKKEPIIINDEFITSLKGLSEDFTFIKTEILEFMEKLRPYQITENDIIQYCDRFKPFCETYVSDVTNKLNYSIKMNGIGFIRTSVLMNNDDYYIDELPPPKWRILRKKYNKLINTAYNIE